MIDLPWGLKSSEAIPLPASIDRSAFNASLQSNNNTRLVTWPKAFPADNFVGDFSRRVRLSASESIIFHGVDQFISTLKALAPNTRINLAVLATDDFLYYAVADIDKSLIAFAVVETKQKPPRRELLDTGEYRLLD